MKFLPLILFLLAGSVVQVAADVIPADRVFNWSNTGVQGGIPNRTNIFVNLLTTTNALYKCYGDGVRDDSGFIAQAFADCPANQVIYAPAAVYVLSNTVSFSSPIHPCTLRGDGTDLTVFSTRHGAFNFTAGQFSIPTNQTANILSGSTVGSSNIIISAASLPYLNANWFLLIDQTNDEVNVTGNGSAGPTTWTDRTHLGKRNLAQLVLIQSVTGGTNITFWPPLNVSFSTNLSAQVSSVWAAPQTGIGLEDFTITNNAGDGDFIAFQWAYGCWVKNVECDRVLSHDIFTAYTLQCTFRDSYFHDAANFTVGNGYGITAMNSWNCLYENNIFYNLYDCVTVEAGSGCVISYNYISHTHSFPTNYMIMAINANHSAHSCFNLYEGNVANEIQADFVWGSSGSLTLFRNYLTSTDFGVTDNQKAISLDAYSLSNNVVGNVLGSPDLTYNCFMITNGVGSPPSIYRFGYPQIGNNTFTHITNAPYLDGTNGVSDLDTRTMATTFMAGNYDYYNNMVIWTNAGTALPGGMVPTTIPNSLIYSAAPSWWGTNRWPAIDPQATPMLASIPAEDRFNGVLAAAVPARKRLRIRKQ